MSKEKIKIVYKFNNISAEEGIDIFEAGPLLMSLGELIKESNRLVGNHPRDIGINVKPVEPGSFIQELLIYAPSWYQDITTLLNQGSVKDLKEVLEWIGIIGGGTAAVGGSLFAVIKKLKGRWTKVEEAGPNEYKYFSENGDTITVNGPVHTLIQSPVIQKTVNNVFYTIPKEVSKDGDVSISTYEVDRPDTIVTFDEDDIESFNRYANQELSDVGKDKLESTTTLYLKPKQGSYKGDRGPYSFLNGRDVVSPVSIEDEDFLQQLSAGIVRLHTDDALQVRLRTEQKIDRNNDIYTHHYIEKVLDYRMAERGQQTDIFQDK